MNFTDEQIATIRAAGFEINPEILQKIQDTIDKFVEEIKRVADAVAELMKPVINWMADICDQIIKLPPRQRYKAVKRLSVENYSAFFQRNQIYHCRNNC